MAIDKKAIAAMARKKKPKMPKASTKDLKAVEVAGVSDDLKQKLFGDLLPLNGTFNVRQAYEAYMGFRKEGMEPSKAYNKVWTIHKEDI